MKPRSVRIPAALLVLAVSCSRSEPPPAKPAEPRKEPEHVRVQHCLVGFRGSVPGKPVTRTKEEARALAHEVLGRARKGEDFADLVRRHTDDEFPGIYGMSNAGIAPRPGELSRLQMVKAFGDVGFSLEVGEIGMAEYDPAASKYGWHILKRVE